MSKYRYPTTRSRVYHKALEEEGIKVIVPTEENQRQVMRLIYQGVKAGDLGYDLTLFLETLDRLYAEGAETLILGCTELPVAFSMYHIDSPAMDPTAILARKAIAYAEGKLG